MWLVRKYQQFKNFNHLFINNLKFFVMDWKTILITAAAVIVIMVVLKKTGLSSKIGLDSFESEPAV